MLRRRGVRRLRNADALVGKCGRCEFREVCGGSRSRSFASTGALMEADPMCVYDPGREVRLLVGWTSASSRKSLVLRRVT